jgi:hypothetical protein
VWDSIINKDWNPINENLWHKGIAYPSGDRLAIDTLNSAYRRAGEQIEKIADLWHSSTAKTLADYVRHLAKLLDFEKKGKEITYKLMNKLFWKSDKAHTHAVWHNKMVRKFYSLADMFDEYESKKLKKKEEPKEEGTREVLASKYMRALNSLKKLLLSYAENIDKVLVGDDPDKVDKLEKWIANRAYNVTNPGSKHPFHPKGEDVRKLKQWIIDLTRAIKKIKGAGNSSTRIIKSAEGGAPPFAILGKKPGVSGKRRSRVAPDASVQKLQRLILQLGIPLKKGVGGKQDDGVWGPSTAAGYKQVMDRLQKLNPKARVYKVSEKHPGKKAIQWGTYVAQRLVNMTGRLSPDDRIDFVSNSTIRVGDLYSKSKYLAYIRMLREQGYLADVHEGEELTEAKKILYNIVEKLAYDKEYVDKLIDESGNPNYANALYKIIMNLLAQLGRAGRAGRQPGKTKYDESGRPLRFDMPGQPGRGVFTGVIDSTNALRDAFKQLPPVRYLHDALAFENYARQVQPSMTVEQYIRSVNTLIAKIQHAIQKFRPAPMRRPLPGQISNAGKMIDWTMGYLADLKRLAETLNVDLRKAPQKSVEPAAPAEPMPEPPQARPAPPVAPEPQHKAETLGGKPI